MLVLTRKSNQSIMIGDDIEVSVLSVMGEKVRIGIQAPQEIPVFRKEIYLEIHREADAEEPSQDARTPTRSRRRRGATRAGRRHLGRRTRRGRGGSAAREAAPASVALAEQQVERAEHHDRDDHRGQDRA